MSLENELDKEGVREQPQVRMVGGSIGEGTAADEVKLELFPWNLWVLRTLASS